MQSALTSLTSLDLSDNIIENLPRDLLVGLTNLQTLYLDGNYLSDDGLTEPMFEVTVRISQRH